MLSVRVYINDREIARAEAINRTAQGAICDYACSGYSEASPITGEPMRQHQFVIEGHDREQSAWALAAAMAARIAELEAPARRAALSHQGEGSDG